jgi:hypothetical protein
MHDKDRTALILLKTSPFAFHRTCVSPRPEWFFPNSISRLTDENIQVQIIYDILGVPLKDVDYLTRCNATRTNGSATASAAQGANT